MAADEGGEVKIRLSQEGGEEILAKLGDIVSRLDDLTKAARDTTDETKELGESLKTISESGAATAFATAVTAAVQFAEVAMRAAESVKHFAEEMVEAKSGEEQMLIQLTSLNEKMLGFSAASEKAGVTLGKLKDLQVLGSDEQLVNFYKRLTTTIGGTDEALIDLTERMKMFAQANGIAAEQMLRVIQMAERTGSLPMRGQMAFVSQKIQELGISGTDIKEAALAGTLDQLLEKLKVSDEMAQRLGTSWETLEAVWRRATNDLQEFVGGGFEPLKNVLKEITDAIKDPAFIATLQGWVASLKSVTQEIVDVLWPALKNLGEALMNALGDPATATVIKGLVDGLATIVTIVTKVVEALGSMTVPLAAALVAYKSLTAAFAESAAVEAATAALDGMAVSIGAVEVSASALIGTLALLVGGITAVGGAAAYAAIYLTQMVPEMEKGQESAERLTEQVVMLGEKLIGQGPQTKEFTDNWNKLADARKRLSDLKAKDAAAGGGEYGEIVDASEMKKAQEAVDKLTVSMSQLEEKLLHPAAAAGAHTAVGPDLTKQITAADEALDKLYEKLDEQHEMAGLGGIPKQLQQIDNQTKATIEQLRESYNKLAELNQGKMSPIDSARYDKAVAQIEKDAVEQKAQIVEAAEDKAREESEARAAAAHRREIQLEEEYQHELTSLGERAAVTKIEQIDAGYARQIDAINRGEQKVEEKLMGAIAEQELALVAAIGPNGLLGGGIMLGNPEEIISKITELMSRITQLRVKAAETDAVIQRQRELALKTEHDHEAEDWQAYYDDILQKASDNGTLTFAVVQETGKKVASEMTANADTAAKGFAAATATITANIHSFGQDISGFLTGIWQSLSGAFQSAFYDVLTGKFDDLGNVLKSLWDSILKDFSQMLAKMLERWLLTGDAMGSGQGGGFGSILSLLKGGGSNTPVTTPGGTSAFTPGQNVSSESDYWPDAGTSGQGGAKGGIGSNISGYAGLAAGVGMIGYGLYTGISSALKPHETSEPTYQGQSLGQTADFGGPGGGGLATGALAVAGGTLLAAQAAVTVGLLTAAAASAATVVGLIVAAALLVAALLVQLFSGPQEGHISIAISDAFDKSGAKSAIGSFVGQTIDATANFVGSLAMKAAGPDGVQKYVSAYQTAFREAYGKATFDIHAGSPEDLQKDVEAFFKTVLPTLAMKAAFGQTGYGFGGNSDVAGGIAGTSWNANNPALMDRDGNWVQKQLYDPKAPIPAMLAGIGFTQEKIGEIAQKLANGADIEQFKKYLSDLVGVVVDMQELAKKFGQTTAEWFQFFTDAEKKQGTAAQFTDSLKNLKAEGMLLETTFGDDRVAKAKQLVSDSQTLLNNMAQALAQIQQLIEAIKKSTDDTIAGYRDKLKTPAERESDARAAYTTDVAAIATAANPKEVQEAWQKVMKDLSQVLDAIVARIQAIKSLQQSYADFRDKMAADKGPQFQTDPAAWLAKNAADIAKVTTDLNNGTGDAVENAQTLLRLTQERYENEVAQLAKINGLIKSITEQGQQTSDNLKMQAMGHVETDPTTGKKTWVADTHAQGEYLKGQYDDLMKQLGTATTPEEVQKIYGKLQGIISQLASQPQDPEHYAESRQILSGMNDAATKAATDLLKKWGKDLDTDIAGTGDKLAAGEKALAKALDAAQKDFDKQLALMVDASDQATQALYGFADGITDAMNELVKNINHWIWLMSHTDEQKDPNWDYDKNAPKTTTPGTGTSPTKPDPSAWHDDPDDPDYEVNETYTPPRRRLKRDAKGNPSGHKPDTQTPGAGATAPGTTSTTTTGPGTTASGTYSAPGTATPVTGGGDDEAKKHALLTQMDELSKKLANTPAVTVNVNAGTPEEIAAAAADAVYNQTVEQLKANNVELVRTLRNNPSLLNPPGQSWYTPASR